MKVIPPARSPLSSALSARNVAVVLLAAALAACPRKSSAVPVVVESESNGAPEDANHVGLLRVGDRLLIEGFVFNNGSLTNPELDGFAFTAATPMHVDFRLFADNPNADLDVCIYDPGLDFTVDCFATPNRPEVGAVVVHDSFVDFHLVVESFEGDSTYTLEISALPFFAATQAPTDPEASTGLAAADGAPAATLTRTLEGRGASIAAGRRAPLAMERYGATAEDEPEATPRIVIEERTDLFVDDDTGTVFVLTRRSATSNEN